MTHSVLRSEVALQTHLFIALSQLTFAKALLKTFSEAQASCKSFYRRKHGACFDYAQTG